MTVTGHWLDQAACLDISPAVFEAKTAGGQQAAIRDYCRGCTVRGDCLADALAMPADQDHGVRGGKTRQERLRLRKRTDLPTGRDPVTIAALRQLLDAEQPAVPRHPAPRPKRRAPKEPKPVTTTAPAAEITAAGIPATTTIPATELADDPEPTTAVRSIADLLDWAASHPDATLRKHAGTAREALTAIQQRHRVDQELEKVQRESAELRERLATLDARAKQLAPAKGKPQRDHDPKTVRAWAWEQGLECPKLGVVPKAIVAAWREATAA